MLIVFDLDGTLIDSAEDLTISVNAMLRQFGKRELQPQAIQTYVGNGAEMLVSRAMGFETEEREVKQALEFFLKYYREHSLQYTTLYPGVQDLVTDLKSMGHTLAVLSNKPVRISTDILAGLKIDRHFFRIYGGDSFSAKKPDPAGLLALIAEAEIPASETLVIGDSPVDIHTARNAGTRCCGVLWGFQPHNVQTSGPDLLIGKPHQLLAYI